MSQNATKTPRYTVEQAREELIKIVSDRNCEAFKVELVRPDEAAAILSDENNIVEGNYPVYRVTEPEGKVWYWDGYCCN